MAKFERPFSNRLAFFAPEPRIIAGLTQTLESIPGIGPIFAAGLIAEIGQIERFEDETKIAKYAGLY